MDTDIVLTRGQIAGLRELVQQDAKRRLLADQDSAWELADLLKSALNIPEGEATRFRLSYGPLDRGVAQAAFGQHLAALQLGVVRLVQAYSDLVNSYDRTLGQLGLTHRQQELAQHATEVADGAARLLADSPSAGGFAVPDGALALYGAQVDRDCDVPERLFLYREQAAQAALAGTEPVARIAWSGPAPRRVALWTASMWLSLDGEQLRSAMRQQDEIPEMYADCLVDPVVQMRQISVGTSSHPMTIWSLIAQGPDRERLSQAVQDAIRAMWPEKLDERPEPPAV